VEDCELHAISLDGVWDSYGNAGMRYPEECDLIGGKTDCEDVGRQVKPHRSGGGYNPEELRKQEELEQQYKDIGIHDRYCGCYFCKPIV
jgi:hypothetical protein